MPADYVIQDLGVHGEDSLDGPPVAPLPVGLDQTNDWVGGSAGLNWSHRSHDATSIAKTKEHAYMPCGHLRIARRTIFFSISARRLFQAACQHFSLSALSPHQVHVQVPKLRSYKEADDASKGHEESERKGAAA